MDNQVNMAQLICPWTNRPLTCEEASAASTLKIPTFVCTICNVMMNNPAQALQHFHGKQHTVNLSNQGRDNGMAKKSGPMKRPFPNARQSEQSINKKPYQSNTEERKDKPHNLSCNDCGVVFNSPASAQQHFTGKKHIQTMAEKSALSTENIPKNDKSELVCNDCGVMFNSSISAKQHLTGRKHAQTIAEKAVSSSLLKNSVTVQPSKPAKDMYCSTCNVPMTSQMQLQQHYNGVKHKLKAGIIKEPPEWWKEKQDEFNKSKPTGKSIQKNGPENFRCETCQLNLNSQIQLSQHLMSNKHKENEERKKEFPGGYSTSNNRNYNKKPRQKFRPQMPNRNTIPLGGGGGPSQRQRGYGEYHF